MVRADVVVRRFTAALLDKEWLMGVRRGWLSLMKPRITDWPDVLRAISRLAEFVENLEKQVTLQRRSPAMMPSTRPALLKKFDELQQFLDAKYRRAKIDSSFAGSASPQDASHAKEVLEAFRTDFQGAMSGVVSGRGGMGMGTRKGDPTELLDRILKILRDSAAQIEKSEQTDPEGTKETWGQEAESEFDLYGMKVVVDDRTVTPQQVKEYVEYLKEAYHRLKAKKLGKAWYGTTFIRCEECGGENPLGKEFGVGGHFVIGPDTVSVFSRPSTFVTYLMVHELGHRYWFKQMGEAQREQFRDLIDLTGKDIESDLKEARESVAARLKYIASTSAIFAKCPVEEVLTKKSAVTFHMKLLPTSVERVLIGAFKNIQLPPDEADSLLQAYKKAVEPATKALARERERLDDLFPAELQTPEMREPALRSINQKVDAWVQANEAALKEVSARFRLDRPTPVSRYGKSNIDEAFAEVFAHYVMEQDMTRDQADSFKHVMRLASVEQPDLLLREGCQFIE